MPQWMQGGSPSASYATVLTMDTKDESSYVMIPSPTDATPLRSKAVDMEQCMQSMQLTREERSAVLEDLRTPAMEMIYEEGLHLVQLALPMTVAALLELVPDTILTMLLGRLDPARSTELLAAFTLASLFRILMISGLFLGISSAIDTLCSQAFGGRRLRELWLVTQAGCLVYGACLPLVAALLLRSAPLLMAMGQDPEISRTAAQLLSVSILAMPFTVVFVILKSTLQAQNIVIPFVYASATAWSISIPIGYGLGYHTRMGYMGIVSAMAISDFIKSLILFAVLLRNDVFQSAWPGWQIREALQHVPMIVKLGASSVLMVTFQMLGFSVTSLLAGMLQNVAVMISANSIFISCLTLAFMPLFGICIAGAVRMGNALGAGKARRASLVGRVVIGACMTVSTFAMAVTAWLAKPYARLFTTNTEAIGIATQMVKSLLIIIPLLGFVFGLQSILRASGKQWLCAKFNFAFLFVTSVPVGLLIAIKLNQGLTGLWFGQCIGMGFFLIAGCVWLYRASWSKMAQEARCNTKISVEDAAR